MHKKKILIVDQDPTFFETFGMDLESQGYAPFVPASLSPLDIANGFREAEMCVLDSQTLRSNFLEVVHNCREQNAQAVLLVVLPADKNDLGLEAIKFGANDFCLKPLAFKDFILSLQKSQERVAAPQKKAKVAKTKTPSFSNIVAQSSVMLDLFQTIKKIADYKTTCLILGESGTGKEMIAKAIHYNSSRKDKPFITVNCGAIPENLLESELFGHAKGAFTGAVKMKKGLFEEADTGTIFLDEIGELPLLLQVKLLRVIQEEEVRKVGDTHPIKINVRIIAATLKDLEKEIEKGTFREDLYYRLNVLPMTIAPLRDRKEDIPVLLDHFIQKMNDKFSTNVVGVDADVMKILMDYDWPGNVREMENAIERSMVLVTGDKITVESLPKNIKATHAPKASMAFTAMADELSIKKLSRLLEEDLIVKALSKAEGNRTRAAKLLEISHRALLYKLKKYKLENKIKIQMQD